MAPGRTVEEMKLVMHLQDRMVATDLSLEEIATKASVNVKELYAILDNKRSVSEMTLILTKCKPVLGELYNQDPRK